MVTVAFWNLRGYPRSEIVSEFVRRQEVDVLILAETDATSNDIESCLAISTQRPFRKVECAPGGKVKIYSHWSEEIIYPVFEEEFGRLTILKLKLAKTDVLVAAVHFQSKMFWSNESQSEEAGVLSEQVRQIEDLHQNWRTVLIGDLNMNPFETGMVSSRGLNAVMTRRLAEGRHRTVNGREYPYFYNPMWGFMGDQSHGPAGTYFYRVAEHVVYFWNMFDQVLLRPDLLPFFHGEVRIIDSIGGRSLLTESEIPNQSVGSDHLPICLTLRV